MLFKRKMVRLQLKECKVMRRTVNVNDTVEEVDGNGCRWPSHLLTAHRGNGLAEEGTDAGLC